MDYPGKVIRKTPVTPTQTSASGVWTVDDALQAVKTNTWPIAGVPNPVSRSLRFNRADSAYLNRTPTTAGNRKTWTWSGWVKRSAIGTGTYEILRGDVSSGGIAIFTGIRVIDDQLYIQDANTASYNFWWVTTAVFRDPSAWYHFVVKYDTTQASSSNAVSLWVNGVSQTLTFTVNIGAYVQNRDGYINATNGQYLGTGLTDAGALSANYFSGYMTEINFIDGQALTPSDFGLTDPQTGQWVPKKYTGTYGTNGFYVNFSDNSSTGTLGYDYSGNGNNWTANNFSVTAGAGNDSLTDVPTPWIAYNTTGDVGGVVRGNYCTLNPLNNNTAVISNGNLDTGNPSAIANWLPTAATMGVSSGKWYWEVSMVGTQYMVIGIFPSTYVAASGTFPGDSASSGYGYYSSNGYKYVLGTSSSYGASYASGDTIGIALDLNAGTLVFYKNGSSQGTLATSISGTFVPGVAVYNNNAAATIANCNFGQRPFAYTPPAGFLSLCTTNLPTPTIGATSTTQAGKYFNTVLYTGNGSTQSISGVGFQPDFTWIKSRSGVGDNNLTDAVRGATITLFSNDTSRELTLANGLTSFNSDGFSVGNNSGFNTNTTTYVAWNWKANGAGSSNTAGSITSTVSASTLSGFSIVTYTGTGSNATVGHGLGVAPVMVIVKCRNASGDIWDIYNKEIGPTKFLRFATNPAGTFNSWQDTNPTSSVFYISTDTVVNTNGNTYVAYCFAPIAGYSAFGSYVGNSSTDGPFIYTGFRPAWVMWKNSTSASQWILFDVKRWTYNIMNGYLEPNTSDTENTGSAASGVFDILSNGFKLRVTGTDYNQGGDTYIYAAFAEFPFKFSNAR